MYFVRMADSAHALPRWAGGEAATENPWLGSYRAFFPKDSPTQELQFMPPQDAVRFPTWAAASQWIRDRVAHLQKLRRPVGKYAIKKVG